MWEGSDIIFPAGSAIFHIQILKTGSSLSCKLPNKYIYIYNIAVYLHMCVGQRGTRSHHRVYWPYHTSKHMAQRRMLENATELMILVCICSRPTHAAAQLPVSESAPALHTHCLRIQCDASQSVSQSVGQSVGQSPSWVRRRIVHCLVHLWSWSSVKVVQGKESVET